MPRLSNPSLQTDEAAGHLSMPAASPARPLHIDLKAANDPTTNVVTHVLEFERAGVVERGAQLTQRLFTGSELVTRLTQARFRHISAYGDYGRSPLTPASPRIVVVASRAA